MRPRVSVIIPAYGCTDFLADAITSVFAQSLNDLELLIVDDNEPTSTYREQTAAIVKSFLDQGRSIIYLQHDSNRNGAAARNTGISQSSGEFISFLDSDDLYATERLEQAVAKLEAAPEHVGGVYTGVEFRRGGKVYGFFRDMPAGNFLTETLACTFRLGTGSNLFLRRCVVEELGGFDEEFWRHQDLEFMVRFFQKYDLATIGPPLVVKNNENFNLPEFARLRQIKKQYLEKYRSVIKGLSEPERNQVIRSNYISLGELALKEGLRRESKECYGVALRHGAMALRDRTRRYALWLLSWLK